MHKRCKEVMQRNLHRNSWQLLYRATPTSEKKRSGIELGMAVKQKREQMVKSSIRQEVTVFGIHTGKSNPYGADASEKEAYYGNQGA